MNENDIELFLKKYVKEQFYIVFPKTRGRFFKIKSFMIFELIYLPYKKLLQRKSCFERKFIKYLEKKGN